MAESSSSEKPSETKPASPEKTSPTLKDSFTLTKDESDALTDAFGHGSKSGKLPESPLKTGTAANGSSSSTIVWVDTLAEVKTTLELINKETRIAVDCEGYNLGRDGTLDIISIAIPDKTVYLLDITTMGQVAFDGELRELLEGDRCEKLMFDCRNDADVLQHKHQVKLSNVLDLQLLDVIHRQGAGGYTQNVNYLWGYKKCLEGYLNDKNLVSIKDRGTKQMLISKSNKQDIWAQRPLNDLLKEYCAVDTSAMFALLDVLSSGEDLTKVKAASARYVDYMRSYRVLPTPRFIFHAKLPHNILSVDGGSRNMECTGCKKMFARDEFIKQHIRQNIQVCRVCRMIKKRGR